MSLATVFLAVTWICATNCGADAEPVTLHLWNIPPRGTSHPAIMARRKVFDLFCRRHPEIRVKALVPLEIEGPAAEGNELMAVAGGVAPDVLYLQGRKVGDYRAQDLLLPLNQFLAGYAADHGRDYAGINAPDKVWQLCHDRGRIIAVPYLYYSHALACRRDLFARAGLGDRVPRNWDELYEFARRLTRDPAREPDGEPGEPQQYGFKMLTGLTRAGSHFMQHVWSAGGEVVEACYVGPDGRDVPIPALPVDYAAFHVRLGNQSAYDERREKRQAVLDARSIPPDRSVDDLVWRLRTDSPEAIEALRFYRRMIHQPWLRNGDHEFDITPEMLATGVAVDPVNGDEFDLGDPEVARRVYRGVVDAVTRQDEGRKIHRARYGMQINVFGEADISEPKLRMAVPFPSRSGANPAAFIAGEYLSINRAITPGREPGRRSVERIRRAAWTYIQFVTGPEAQRIRVETFVAHGLAPYVRPGPLKAAGYGDLLDRIPPMRQRLWEDLDRWARVEPFCEGFTTVQTRELPLLIERIINDRPDPRTGRYRLDLQQVMNEVVDRVNARILGRMSDEQVRRRSRIGWLIFAGLAAGLMMAAVRVVQLAMRSTARGGERIGAAGRRPRRAAYAWAMLLPAVVTVLIWNYYPLARGMIMAFQDYRLLGDSRFVGLRNFIEVVASRPFWLHLVQTFEYVLMLVGIGFIVPIVLAVLLSEIPRGKIVYRVIYYLPAVTTGLVTLFLWKQLFYDPTDKGVLNRLILSFNAWPLPVAVAVKLLMLLGLVAIFAALIFQAVKSTGTGRERWISGAAGATGLALVLWFLIDRGANGGAAAVIDAFWSRFAFERQTFLRDRSLVMLWLVLPVIWAGAGPGCLIYLAALKSIPDQQYEAADLDGAGVWKKFWFVTVPNLHALIIINFVGAVIAGFKESGNIFVMTGGGPEDRSMVIGLDIWFRAFLYLDFGAATAMGWIMAALLIGFTLHQLRILNRLQFRAAAAWDSRA